MIIPTVNIDSDKCTGCSTCEELCPMNVFVMNANSKKAEVSNEKTCIGCRACESQCPEHCITIDN